MTIKRSLIPFADIILKVSKKIHGKDDMSKYLNFYHVKYCKDLTDKERMYLEKKGAFGIGKAIKHLFGKGNAKKIE